MPARQVRGQFRTEQMGVASRENQSSPRSLETIDDDFPARDVLDFVEEDSPGTVVDGVDGREEGIGATRAGRVGHVALAAQQPLVVEVDVARRRWPNRIS